MSFSGHLPSGDGNGLSAIVGELTGDPKRLHVVIALLDVPKVTTNTDSGEVVPSFPPFSSRTVRIRRVEVLTRPDDMKVAERLMRRALDERTGREALPYDLESEIAAAFEGAEQDEPEPQGDEDVEGGGEGG
jgi:hypothetical protein